MIEGLLAPLKRVQEKEGAASKQRSGKKPLSGLGQGAGGPNGMTCGTLLSRGIPEALDHGVRDAHTRGRGRMRHPSFQRA